MNNGYIAVLDSGVGGLSVLGELVKIMPFERYLYLGDNANAPYGQKSDRELRLLALSMINQLSRYPLKAIVVGCNTLSVTLIDQIKKMTQTPVFGVFPPVEEAIINKEKTLLLCTPNTAKKYAEENECVDVLSLPCLAKDIEDKFFNVDKINFDYHVLTGKFYSKKSQNEKNFFAYTKVILGCTHYFFAQNKIFDHFRPQKITSGNHLTAKKVRDFLLKSKSLENNKRFDILFIGKNAFFNQKCFNKVVKLF